MTKTKTFRNKNKNNMTTNIEMDDNTSHTPTTTTTNNNNNNNNNNNIAKKAIWGTISTILLRLISFICTQYTYRKLADNPSILGSTQIKFELLLSTILFISREGFRLALMSTSSSVSSNQRKSKIQDNTKTSNDEDSIVWNLVAWLTIPVSTIVSLLALIWITTNHSDHNNNNEDSIGQQNNNYDQQYGAILYCVAACIEGYGEPAVLIALRDMNVTIKSSAEGLAVIIKTTILPMLLSSSLSNNYPITSFGIAQIIYSIVYTIFLYWNVRNVITYPNISLLWNFFFNKQKKDDDDYDVVTSFHQFVSYINKVVMFTIQGLLKHALTEGDRIVLTMLSGSYDQGVYAMGSSYGSLAARLLLQPLEENARLLWSRIVSSNNRTIQQNEKNCNNNDPTNNNESLTSSNHDNHNDVLLLLKSSYIGLVKIVLYIGFIFSCFAVNYTRIVLVLLAGNKWGSNQYAATVLSAFCIYTAFLAWNGMTEAFVYAIIASSTTTTNSSSTDNDDNTKDTTTIKNKSNNNQLANHIGQLSIAHTAVGIIFAIVASFAVKQYGTVGLVIANCIAMFVRAIYSVSFAARYFVSITESHTTITKNITIWKMFIILLRDMFPKPIVIISFLFSYEMTRQSLQHMEAATIGQIGTRIWYEVALQHIFIGITCAIGTITMAYYTEHEFRKSIISMWKGGKQNHINTNHNTAITKVDKRKKVA